MSEPITYVGIDAHKVQLHVALLAPDASSPVTWTVQNEARAVGRLRRKLEKAGTGSRRLLLRSRAVRLCIAAAARGGPGPVPSDRAGAGAAQAGGADQDRPAGRAQVGGAASGGTVDGGAAANLITGCKHSMSSSHGRSHRKIAKIIPTPPRNFHVAALMDF